MSFLTVSYPFSMLFLCVWSTFGKKARGGFALRVQAAICSMLLLVSLLSTGPARVGQACPHPRAADRALLAAAAFVVLVPSNALRT